MGIFDHTEEESPQEYIKDLVRSVYKDADQKNIDFSSEKQVVHVYQNGIARGTLIPTYTNLQHAVQSLMNELDDWKNKYSILSKELTMLNQELQAQRELTKIYQEQLVEIITKK